MCIFLAHLSSSSGGDGVSANKGRDELGGLDESLVFTKREFKVYVYVVIIRKVEDVNNKKSCV